MLIGIIGAPNKGKSTLFSALTSNEVPIADYPFTTIDPNKGIAYATKQCVDASLSVRCNARNSLCVNGTRMLPVNVVDVAGLVEGAHRGKGMGNRFLNDLAGADAFMVVVDASGKTDCNGNPCNGCNPMDDVAAVRSELSQWLSGIVKRNLSSSKGKKDLKSLQAALTGLKVGKGHIEKAAERCSLPTASISWDDEDVLRFSEALLEISKPIVVVANKVDALESRSSLDSLDASFGGSVFECSAAIELALRKASSKGVIDYVQGGSSFRILEDNISPEQERALEYMRSFLGKSANGTGVQSALNSIVFKVLDNIVVYPVEDENKYTDHSGNVLPDAVLLKRGSTAQDLAAEIHTDLAKGMLYAVDAVRKVQIGKDHVLQDNDVIRIVSTIR